jgi:nucleoid-associated protein YgaU
MARHASTAAAALTPTETAIVVIVVTCLFAAAWFSGRPALPPAHTTSVRVEQGDTLWSLAKQHRAEGMTTAETVELLAQLNRIDGATIRVGDVIDVPASLSFDAEVALAMR